MADNYLTEQDVQNYGSDLVDLAQRASLHALAPELETIRQQNAALAQRLSVEARRNLDLAVERQIPNYREVDRDPRWHEFLRGIDPFTGQQFQALLNIAIMDGSASRVAAIFRGFMNQVGDTPAPAAARAAPGRTRSASSGQKPVYSREDIADLYEQHRRGEIAEGEWAKIEADIFQAQRENRISGRPYLTK